MTRSTGVAWSGAALISIISASAVVRGQSATNRPGEAKFDAVSISPNRARDVGSVRAGTARVTRSAGGVCGNWGWIRTSDTCFTATALTVHELIEYAHNVSALIPPLAPIASAPDWLEVDRFDIVARATGETSPLTERELAQRLRSLLAERFGLELHHETRNLPSYDLVANRKDGRGGPQMHAASTECVRTISALRAPSRNAPAVRPHDPCVSVSGRGYLKGGAVDMAELAWVLSNRTNTTVRDKTSLPGMFAIDFTWDPGLVSAGALSAALQEQLGLMLVTTTGPVDVLVIDRVSRPPN